jgi:cytoplasmic iron level regulating protein YaaA (DUF328/UPF0246 family)
MMKILFSPSETKRTLATHGMLEKENLVFPSLYEKRHQVLMQYQVLLKTHDTTLLQNLFGIKDTQKILIQASKNIFDSFTCKAILRYSGIAYDHLLFETLDKNAQAYIEHHVMIFSNLFGPLLAGDLIPEYKLQQGESLDGFKTENFYKEHFSDAVDTWIGDETILDLRAGYYEKFYTLKKPFITMKFLKNDKVVSHYAKAYRGQVLREIAIHQPNDEKELGKIGFEGLRVREIKEQKLKREYIFDIID